MFARQHNKPTWIDGFTQEQDGVNVRWSMGLVSDQLANGQRFLVLSVVDDFSHECVLQVLDFTLSTFCVVERLERLAEYRPLPEAIVCYNISEFTGKAMFFWARDYSVRLHFIHADRPTQCAFIESFNQELRESCLDPNWFTSIEDARAKINKWGTYYNRVRPLGKKTSAELANEVA